MTHQNYASYETELVPNCGVTVVPATMETYVVLDAPLQPTAFSTSGETIHFATTAQTTCGKKAKESGFDKFKKQKASPMTLENLKS